MRLALRDRVVWTLDTAAQLACGRGFLSARDLTGYLSSEDLHSAVDQALIEEPKPAFISVDPVFRRPSMLIVHLMDQRPRFFTLPSGDRVVTWDFLIRDIMGTIGWRPDILTRIEDRYRRVEAEVAEHR